MGAFDNDKTLGRGVILQETFTPGEKFYVWELVEVIHDLTIPGHEDYGPTTKAILSVSKMDTPQERFEVGCIGAAGEKMSQLTEDETPCICSVVGFTSSTYDREGTTVQWVENVTDEQADALSTPL